MFWEFPLKIQTYTSENQQWGHKIFEDKEDFIIYMEEQFKESPDMYKLKNVENFQIEGIKYSLIQKQSKKPNFEGGYYTKSIKGTHQWKKYWGNEVINAYEVNPKSGKPSLCICKGNKTFYKPIN